MRSPLPATATLFAFLLVLQAGEARGQNPVDEPAAIAAAASEVRDRYCSDASGAAVTQQAEGTAAVSSVWARVSRSYDAHRAEYLLYWRALLGQCIDKMDLVQDDLEAFIAAVGTDVAYAEQVRDAERRLRRIRLVETQESRPRGRPAVGVGVALAAGGGVMAGLSAWQGQEMQQRSEEWHSGELVTEQFDLVEASGLQAEAASNGLLGAAIGLGTAGVVVAVVGAVVPGSGRSISAVAVPTPGGVAVAIGGRW